MSKKQVKKKGGSTSKVKAVAKSSAKANKVSKTGKKAKPAPKTKKIVKKASKSLPKSKGIAKTTTKKAVKKTEKKAAKVSNKTKSPVKNSARAADKKNSTKTKISTDKVKDAVKTVSVPSKKINTEVNKVTKPIVEKTQANQVNKPLFNASPIIQQKINEGDMKDEKLRYSEDELKEFEVLISDKLIQAKKELNYIKETLSRKNDPGTDTTAGTLKLLEDGADTAEKENFTQLAARQQKFIQQLENAMARIKNGTYGICVETGKLIPKERLRAVPHTQHSIEAKLNRKD
jgi:RNA polymerase-binding transcription factor DksA